ncbi:MULTISPECIES: hypothetical protein [unclassified Bradyrhizobium]
MKVLPVGERDSLQANWQQNVADYFAFAAAFSYLVLSLLQASENSRSSELAFSLLAINGIAALVGLRIAIVHSYVLFGVFFIFNFLFLAVAPLQQMGADFDPVFYNLESLILACALSLFMTLVGLGVVVARNHQGLGLKPRGFLYESMANWPAPNYALLATISVIVSVALFGYLGAGLFALTRETYSVDLSDKTANIIVNAFLRPLTLVAPFVGLAIALKRRDIGWAAVLFLLVLVGAAINNPLVSARFRSSALIVFCVLAIFGVRRVRLFIGIYMIGLMASPIFGTLFRYNNARADQRSFSQFFVHVDFSGIDIFCYAIMWVDRKGLEWGSNIIGALFFFVPRILWENKGKTVGETIHDYIFVLKGFGTDNVSAPPPVEGYFSFGVAGAMLLSVAVVLFIDRLERRGLQSEVGSPIYFVLCLSPMLCMILLRGPFQVGVSEWTMHASTSLLSSFALWLGCGSRPQRARNFHRSATADRA